MQFDFDPAPSYEGLTFIGVKPIFFHDPVEGLCGVFPLYNYRNDATGELITVAEDIYEKYHDIISRAAAEGGEDGRR